MAGEISTLSYSRNKFTLSCSHISEGFFCDKLIMVEVILSSSNLCFLVELRPKALRYWPVLSCYQKSPLAFSHTAFIVNKTSRDNGWNCYRTYSLTFSKNLTGGMLPPSGSWWKRLASDDVCCLTLLLNLCHQEPKHHPPLFNGRERSLENHQVSVLKEN